MSAPLVVNTVEGTVWTRRPFTRDGADLYAPQKCTVCPEFVMATYAELVEHGVAGEAFALPVPTGATSAVETLPLAIAVELQDLRARVAGMANPPREVFLALYDGAEPEVFTTPEAARAYCDDIAPVDAHGKGWDWTVNEYGVHIQFWTDSDNDRPLSTTPGSVTPVVVQGDEPLSELERLRARVTELESLLVERAEPDVDGAGRTYEEYHPQPEVSADRLTALLAPTQALADGSCERCRMAPAEWCTGCAKCRCAPAHDAGCPQVGGAR